MNIASIDKNFEINRYVETENDKRHGIPNDTCSLYGVFYDQERQTFLRMPQGIAEKISPQVAALNENTAGGRVKFSTDSNQIGVCAKWDVFSKMPHMPLTGSSGFTLCEETEDGELFLNVFKPTFENENGLEQIWTDWRPRTMRNYVLYFPLYNQVKQLEIIVNKDAVLGEGKAYKNVLPILYYGSSITQGACASRADNCYQAYIAKHTQVDYINLGFSGSAKAEKEMAEYLSNIPCSVFVCDYDYNAPTIDYLRETHLELYKTFRKKQKDVPVILMSSPSMETFDWSLNDRLKVIKDTYEYARSNGDEHIYLISGRDVYGNKDFSNCVVDGCHPNDLGFYRIAEMLEKTIKKLLPHTV